MFLMRNQLCEIRKCSEGFFLFHTLWELCLGFSQTASVEAWQGGLGKFSSSFLEHWLDIEMTKQFPKVNTWLMTNVRNQSSEALESGRLLNSPCNVHRWNIYMESSCLTSCLLHWIGWWKIPGLCLTRGYDGENDPRNIDMEQTVKHWNITLGGGSKTPVRQGRSSPLFCLSVRIWSLSWNLLFSLSNLKRWNIFTWNISRVSHSFTFCLRGLSLIFFLSQVFT